MTQNSSPWDGIGTGDAINAPYSSLEWAHLWALMNGVGATFPNYGIIPGSGGGSYAPLRVIATGAANVDVKIGAALVNGRLYETDAAVSLTVGANASGNARIDTVVLRVDYTAQTVRPVIRQGTPAASPARVTLTQNTTTFEIPLADIAVANGFSTINQSDITDRRRAAPNSDSGWQPVAYLLDKLSDFSYTGAVAITSGTGIIFPFVVQGNMLVHQMTLFGGANASPTIRWGIYQQNGNDLATADKTLYNLGGRDAAATISVTTNNRINVAADQPVYLSPGAYWLKVVVHNANLTIAALNRSGSNRFDENAHMYLTKSSGLADAALVQTDDFTSGWVVNSSASVAYAIRLEGRVFGQATAF